MVQIKKGVIPEQMEDRWYMYYSDGCLHIHNSWTNFKWFIVRFDEQDDKATALDFKANRDPDQYKEPKYDDKRDKELVTFLIDTFLLGCSVSR